MDQEEVLNHNEAADLYQGSYVHPSAQHVTQLNINVYVCIKKMPFLNKVLTMITNLSD